MFSREVKAGLLEYGDITISDLTGSTEGGMGMSVVGRANPCLPGEAGSLGAPRLPMISGRVV